VHLLHQVRLLALGLALRHMENIGFLGITLLVGNGFQVTGDKQGSDLNPK